MLVFHSILYHSSVDKAICTGVVFMRILLFICFLPLTLLGQDYAGVWTGHIYSRESQVPYELVISGDNSSLKGYSLMIFTIGDVQNTGIKSIKIKDKKSGISLEDDKLVYNDYQTASKKVTLFAELSFEKESDNILTGSFFTRSVDRSSYKGTIRLERKDDKAQTKLISFLEKMNLAGDLSFRKTERIIPGNDMAKVVTTAQEKNSPVSKSLTENRDADAGSVAANSIANIDQKKDDKPVSAGNAAPSTTEMTAPVVKDPAVAASLPAQRQVNVSSKPIASTVTVQNTSLQPLKTAAADLALRKTEIIRDINFKADSLVLSLYDNGEVDGDTVSVLVNGQLVIARKGLTTNAIKTTVYATGGFGDSLQVVMYAENLGRIAPNTGLLVVEDGEEKYQVRFEGDYQKNAAIVFRRKRQ